MKHKISEDRSRLTITIDDSERAELREMGDTIQQDATMHDFLEPLACNSDLEWIDPSETGDLTGAPMLGFRTFMQVNPHGNVISRWAFMDYQTRSVLEDLRDKGECVFVGGDL